MHLPEIHFCLPDWVDRFVTDSPRVFPEIEAGGFDLFATTEPCAMSFGAVPWSGVNSRLNRHHPVCRHRHSSPSDPV
jgi:hypothetical protein